MTDKRTRGLREVTKIKETAPYKRRLFDLISNLKNYSTNACIERSKFDLASKDAILFAGI